MINFDQFLKSFDSSAGQKERIALAVYYLEEQENKDRITQSEVKNIIRSSKASITPSSVSMYFTRLKEGKWLTESGDTGYCLTISGEEEVTSMIDGEILNDKRDDLFIATDVFEGEDYYGRLIVDINQCYEYRIYDATLVLTRKFFEHLVFKILQKEYAGEDNQMFYDQENNEHYRFDDLLDNLKDGVPRLRKHTYGQQLDKELVADLRKLKDEGNKGAHSVRIDISEEEIEGIAEDATRLTEILFEVFEGVQLENQLPS